MLTQDQIPWQFESTADKSSGHATWVQVMLPDGEVLVAHYAYGGGDERPPFRGWFKKSEFDPHCNVKIPRPDFWRRLV